MSQFKDLTGKRFGMLTVLRLFARRTSTTNTKWSCLCDCGTETVVDLANLGTGKTRSCGHTKYTARRTHGYSRSQNLSKRRTFSIWSGMLQRCKNRNTPGFQHYGGRGIIVCKRWHDFSNFLADMGEAPDGLTIDRKDNNGNYEPENCKWATRIEQANNTQKPRYLEYQGEVLPVAVLHRQASTPIALGAFWIRIRNGWPVGRALSQPVEPRRPRRTA